MWAKTTANVLQSNAASHYASRISKHMDRGIVAWAEEVKDNSGELQSADSGLVVG